MEKTLVLVKPDGVAKGLTGEIIARFERRGLVVCALKMLQLSQPKPKFITSEHKAKPFFVLWWSLLLQARLSPMVIGGKTRVKVV